jgi:hypothetical protein
MIKDTLAVLSKGASLGDAAKELGVVEGDLKGRLGVLEKMGYIKIITSSGHESSACAFCPSASVCKSLKEPTYSLTEKGKRAVMK